MDVRTGLSEQRREFEDAGSEDRRRGEQEREAGGVSWSSPRDSPHDRHARPGDPGEQREHLQQADRHTVAIRQSGDARIDA